MFGNFGDGLENIESLRAAEEKIGSASNVRQPMRHAKTQRKLKRE
jgi:hypothetical protein